MSETPSEMSKYEEQFYRFSSEKVGSIQIDTLFEILNTKKLHEHVALPPFNNIQELRRLLTLIGKAYEIGFDYLIPPYLKNSGRIYDYQLVVGLENGDTVLGSFYKPNVKKYMSEIREHTRIIRLEEAQLAEVLHKIGFLGGTSSLVVLTKGNEDFSGALKFQHFNAHSHPQESPVTPSYGDLGIAYDRLLNHPKTISTPLPSVRRSIFPIRRLFTRNS